MTPLTTAEKLALLDRLQKLHQAASKRHDELRRFLNTTALEPFWQVVDFANEQVTARIGCSWNDLDWHAMSNDWGANRLVLNGVWVRNNADFLRAVEKGES